MLQQIITELKFVTLEIEEDQLEWVALRIYYIFLYTIGNEILFKIIYGPSPIKFHNRYDIM